MNAAIVEELRDTTVGQALRQSTERHGDRAFIVTDSECRTFAEFGDEVDRLSRGLLANGIGRGDHVAVWLPNAPQWALVFFACARIGAVVVPINTRYRAAEAAYILRQSDARALFIRPPLWNTDYYGLLTEIAPEVAEQEAGSLDLAAFPELRLVIHAGEVPPPGTTALDAVMGALDGPDPDAAEAAVTADDHLLICYTSGTTGKPKGAIHSHRVLRQATRVGLALHVEPGDLLLGHMPLYHVAGLYMGLVTAMTLGAGIVLMLDWDAEQALDLMETRGVNVFGGIPTHFYDLLAAPSRARRRIGIKSAWIGGSPVMQKTVERILADLNIGRLLSTYGMTENTISTTMNRWDDPLDKVCRNMAPLLSDCEVRIVDPETFRDVPPGRDGEIWCRGETVMVGYYRNERATAETITAEGWLRTGDIGRFEGEYLTLSGRLKEMYKIGGTNAYPVEIEQFLMTHPGIRMAVVVGVPDERLGEVGCAFIELEDGSGLTGQDVVAHCKGHLADYKIPRYVRFVTDYPRTATGKIRKSDLVSGISPGLRQV